MLPSADLIRDALGYGVLVPAAVTLAVWALWRWAGRRRPAPALSPSGGEGDEEGAGGALAVGAGLLAGWAALAWSEQLDWGFLRPADSWHWLLPLSLLAVAAGAVERGFGVPGAARWALRLAVAGLTAWLLVGAESAVQPLHPTWYAAVGVAVLGLWGALDPAARLRPAAVSALLATVALGAGAVLESAGIMSFAQLAGVFAAVLAACAVLGWWLPNAAPSRGAVPAVAVLLPGLLFVGYSSVSSYTEVPAASFLLVLAAPLALGATACLVPVNGAGRWRAPLCAAATLLPLAAAVALAVLA